MARLDLVCVTDTGWFECDGDDQDKLAKFDIWIRDRACEHEEGILSNCYIGNATLVAKLWDEVANESQKFPVLLSKVLYNATYCGYFINKPDIKNLDFDENRANTVA